MHKQYVGNRIVDFSCIAFDCGNHFRRFRLFSGFWGQVEAAPVDVDRVDKVVLIPEAACRVLHPLDFDVNRFAARVAAHLRHRPTTKPEFPIFKAAFDAHPGDKRLHVEARALIRSLKFENEKRDEPHRVQILYRCELRGKCES